MEKDLAVIIAWPETLCKQAGAWYDNFLKWLAINKNGYYKVGHAAIVLVKRDTGDCFYFDFGRYHTPRGYGRVRDASTDHDLAVNTKISFDISGDPLNLAQLLHELSENISCHGTGEIKAGIVSINFDKAYSSAKGLQKRDFMQYGPFVLSGTNCSRFVRTVALKGIKYSIKKLKLQFPVMLTPTPLWNVKAANELSIDHQLNNIPIYETRSTKFIARTKTKYVNS